MPPQAGGITPTAPPEARLHRLRFTGTATHEDFLERCRQQDFWYHSYYFDNGYEVRGDYNIGLDIETYPFPRDLTGMSILDVGTGAGWFAFYFAQRGAEVTAVDARGYCDFDRFGWAEYPPVETEKPEPDRLDDDGNPVYFSSVSGGFWVMRDLLGSKVRFVNARVYELHPDLFGGTTFDLVFMGALLLHLRDPIGGLMAARRVCHGITIATTPVARWAHGAPMMELPYVGYDAIAWWRPNEPCFAQWFYAAGFSDVDVSREVKLTADVPVFSEAHPGDVRNPDQILRVGYARVSPPEEPQPERRGWRSKLRRH